MYLESKVINVIYIHKWKDTYDTYGWKNDTFGWVKQE